MVLPLAWLYRVAPTAEHRGWLYRILADLKVNQVACGAIREELKQRNSHVHISAFCPGPVATEFNEVANVKFSTGPISSKTAAHKALGGVLKGKPVIVPSLKIKSLKFIKRLLPDTLITQMCYHFQKKKQ